MIFMKIIGIIQARLGSTRLPNKVLLELLPGKTVLECMLERVKRSKLIEKVIVATTDSDKDKVLVKYLQDIKQAYFAGSEADVLDRYYQAAKTFGLETKDVIVRLTADCPLIDPNIIDAVIQYYCDHNFDYVSNGLEPYTYPDGMDTEVFSFADLKKAWLEAKNPTHREHVTFYFWKNPDKFNIGRFTNKNSAQANYRLTLDYPEDYELIRQVYTGLHRHGIFTMDDIIKYLNENVKVRQYNAHIIRNESWQNA